MKFTVENNDFGDSYIVRFEDDSYALVNLFTEEVFYDSPEALMSMGFWMDDKMQPVSDEVMSQIESIIENAEDQPE